MVQAILNVFAIIALVLVGGFIIYALVELILSADGKRGTLFFRNRKNTDRDNEILLEYNKNVDTNDSFRVQNQNNHDLMLDFDKQYEQETLNEENTTNVNLLKADEEQKLIEAKRHAEANKAKEEQEEKPEVYDDFVYINKENPEKQKEEEKVEETKEEIKKPQLVSDDDDDEEDDDDQSIEEILNSIQERNKNARNRFLADIDDDEDFDETEEDEDYKLASEINKKVVSPVEEEKVEEVEETKVDSEEIEKLNSIISELNAKIEEEKAKNEEMAEKQKAIEEEKESLKKALEDTKNVDSNEEITEETLNLYNAKLDELLERQKQNDKDLRLNKKEYLPLLRIEKTLESDKAKLRRKEAIVAKKKMVLFGVNNYVVDPEKEKKLLEDQDLLEGLKLSVAHCEEVMDNNKDRYPVLQHANEILTRNAAEIQADIDEIKAKIEHANEVLSKDSDGTQSE